MANIYEPEWDESNDLEGFRNRRARLGRQAGAERLGASVYELEPGQAAWPLHYHVANEELVVVLSGTLVLRTPAGERELATGELVAMPVGERGAHQVINRSGEPARMLVVSEMVSPDIVVRPESGKISAFERAPGSREEGMHLVFFERDKVAFWEGEAPPPNA